MPTLTSRLAPLRTLALVALALTTLNSCGAPDLDQASRLRDRPVSTDAGTLADRKSVV